MTVVEPVETPTPVVELVETPFTVLVVCTGNICRSPLAEQLLRDRFAAAGIPVNVHSAGTGAMVGQGMTQQATDLSLRYGGVPTTHEAQQLTEALVANADLVLTATREHRSEVVSLHPRSSRYAYTLNQFARLVPVVEPVETPVVEPHPVVEPVETLRAFLAEIAATRGLTPPPAHPHDDDIIDPYRQSQEVYDRAGRAIDAAVTTITSSLVAAIGRA